MKKVPQTGRSFFWHGVLILLPVVLLSSAGFLSLRQDRMLARHEAVEKAQALAEQLADIVWKRLFRPEAPLDFPEQSFRLDAQGNLAFPPPQASSPEPLRLEPGQLTEAQRPLWTILTAAPPTERGQAITSAQEFLALAPPPAFAALAQFRLAQQLEGSGRHQEAAAQFEQVGQTFPEAIGETGLALQPLAALKALQLAAEHPPGGSAQIAPPARTLALQTFCSNLVFRPTFLSDHLLGRASDLQSALNVTNVVEPWLEEQARHKTLRELARVALRDARVGQTRELPDRTRTQASSLELTDPGPFAVPALFWFHMPDLNPGHQAIYPPGKSIMPKLAWYRNELGSVALSKPVSTGPSSGNLSLATAPSPPSNLERFWLAAKLPAGTEGSHWIVCRALGIWNSTQTVVGSPPLDDLKQGLPILPPWLDFKLHLAGVSISSSNGIQRVTFAPRGNQGDDPAKNDARAPSGAGSESEILANAVRLENGTEYLRVQLTFASPQLFYARQRARTYVFGGLIGLAAAAALVGFISAQRAFLRQQQLSELKSNFVSSVSHELRAPIASMRLMAESLERGKVSDPARQGEYYTFLVQECRRLSALIENVLNFARIEQGRKQYELEPTDVAGLLQQTAKLLEPAATAKQVQLALDLPAEALAGLEPPPLLDGPAIQQALINLLDNALKHSPVGGIVTIGLRVGGSNAPAEKRVSTQEPPAPVLALYVQDHGPGIPPEEHERIFERFYRRGSELRRETQGIGIGLSIVKHIAEAHHGRVRVDSRPGQGSTFTLELPRTPNP